MTHLLSRLAALTGKDEHGLSSCPFCGKQAMASKGTHANAQLWVSCTSKLCIAGQDECTPGMWNNRPREAALIALVREAAGEIERLKEWQTVALAIGARAEERVKERVPDSHKCGWEGFRDQLMSYEYHPGEERYEEGFRDVLLCPECLEIVG